MTQQTSLDDRERQQTMLSHPLQGERKRDPMVVVLLISFVVGMLCILFTGWVVYTRQQDHAQVQTQQIVGLENKLHGTSKELATVYAQSTLSVPLKQAQQTEFDRLNAEFIQILDMLATVSSEATLAVIGAQTREAVSDQTLASLQNEVSLLSTRVADPTHSAAVSAPAVMLDEPPLALVLDAPVYKQERNLSCESSSAAMAANFFGVRASEAHILASLPLDANPHKGFRGNVDGPHGGIVDYGVYAEPIRQVLVDLGLTVDLFSGGTEDIRSHLCQGRVLVAWITYDLQVQTPRSMTLDSGDAVTMVPYEHALLIVGYNSDGFWVNDPYTGTAKFYTESEFARSFAYLGNMALVVGPPK